MQREVIERLLPTLHLRFPERAQDLISGYHDLLGGKDTNTVFGNTFKGLEELARQLPGNDKLMLNKPEEVQKHFPQLHPTIIKTIANIANHRGDEAGHGRKGPDQVEMRYLLFQICNIALLMLEYYPPTSKLYSLDS